jgi:hypothetical protein
MDMIDWHAIMSNTYTDAKAWIGYKCFRLDLNNTVFITVS